MAPHQAGDPAGADAQFLDANLLQAFLQLRASSGYTPVFQEVQGCPYDVAYLADLEQQRVNGTLSGEGISIYSKYIAGPQWAQFMRRERDFAARVLLRHAVPLG